MLEQVGTQQDPGSSTTISHVKQDPAAISGPSSGSATQRDSINSAASSSAETGASFGVSSDNSDRDSSMHNNDDDDRRNSVNTTATSDTSSSSLQQNDSGSVVQARPSCSADPASISHPMMQNYTSLPSSTSIHTSHSSSALSYSSQRLLASTGHEPGISSTGSTIQSSGSLASSQSMRSSSSLSHSSVAAVNNNGAIPASPIAREQQQQRRHTRNTSETSATNLDVANLDLAEGEGTFETTATGLFSRYGEGLGISNAGAGSRASASASSPQREPRRGFLSTLLNRSSSFNGRSSPSSTSTSTTPTPSFLSNTRTPPIPSSAAAAPDTHPPHRQLNYPARSHSSIGTYPHNTNTNNTASSRDRQESARATISPSSSSVSNGNSSLSRSHRNSGIAPSPSLPTNLSAHAESSSSNRQRNRLSSALAPSAHDGVFSSISASASMNNLPTSASSPSNTLSPDLAHSRNARFRGHLSSPAAAAQAQPAYDHQGHATRSSTSASQRGLQSSPSLPFMNGHSTHKDGDTDSLPKGIVTPSLEAIGLHLLALSPNLSLGRYGQPLCGAVLDGKYLLIGTTFGLDFLPLNRAGNKSSKGGLFERFASASTSSSSASNGNMADPLSSGTAAVVDQDIKTRKPISLIKKTRFKQLVVLSERSNVLLAVAGRNDHVRVYALDSLRKLIEKKIKEIDDKEGPPVPVIPPQHHLNTSQGSAAAKMKMKATQQSPSAIKGKGRASPIPPPLPLSSSSSSLGYRQHQERVKTPLLSLPPAYVFGEDFSNPSQQQYARRRSSATSSGPPTPRYRRSSRPSTAETSLSNNNSRPPSLRSSPIPSPHTSPSASIGGTREFHASSPRALRRGNKSRETLRRGSTSATTSSAGLGGNNAFSPGSVSRRGSAATVTPHTVAALAAGSASPPLPSSSSAISSGSMTRRRGSSITMYESGIGGDEIPPTPGLPEVYRREMSYNNLQALEDESYEWVDAPEDPDTEILAGEEARPSIPHDSISPSTSYNTIPMYTSVSVDSTLSSLLSSPPTSSVISSSSQFSGNQYSPSPSSSALSNRNRSTSITFSAMSRSSSSNLSRMQPRSPIAIQEDTQVEEDEQAQEAENDEEASETASQRRKAMRLNTRRLSLAEILRESKMSPTLQGQMSRSTSATGFYNGSSGTSSPTGTPMARSATATSSHEDMNSLADFLRAGPPAPEQSKSLVRSRTTDSLASNKDKAPEATKRETANKARMLPRSPVLPSAMEERETTLGLLDFMKNGPGPAPVTSSTSESASSEERSTRRLSKSSRPKRSGSQTSLAASLSALLPSSFLTAEPVPSIPRSPALASLHAKDTATPGIEAGEGRSRSNSARSGQRSPRLRTMTSPEAETPNPLATSRAAKRMSLQPRSPTVRNQADDAIAPAPEMRGTSNMTRSFSLQEALSAEPEIMEATSPRTPATTSSEGLARSASSASGEPHARQRNRKRWSLLEGLRGPGSSPLLASSSNMSLNSSGQQTQTGSPALPQTGSTHITPSASQSSTISLSQQAAPALPSTPEVPLKPRPGNLEEDSPPFANLVTDAQEHTNPDGTTITFTQTDVTSVASGMNNSKNRPSGLGNSSTAAAAGTLEYVKLARTKGSRFIRASETKKRTYLAVLCGEQGERIELFTGSKNVSLSLNRTFVLPETPRTIEFQLQGEDLLDLYLIYDSAIFALEPSTVRVREVGIHRNERRAARRERDRQAREAALTANSQPQDAPEGSPSGEGNEPGPGIATEAPASSPMVNSTSAAESWDTQNGDQRDLSLATIDGTATQTVIPYTTFQQLEYLPPLPASVLSASYIIPPTYDSVLSASPMPSQDGFSNASSPYSRSSTPAMSRLPSHTFTTALATPSEEPLPLLMPVSLLSNPTARNPGPPGLFFVSKGRTLTGIVDGDGRSVIKKSVSWLSPEVAPVAALEQAQGLEIFTRLEIVLSRSKTSVCIVAFGPSCIRATELGGSYDYSIEVIPPLAIKQRAKSNNSLASVAAGRELEDIFFRDVTYLAKTAEATFFAERVGNNVTIHTLAASQTHPVS